MTFANTLDAQTHVVQRVIEKKALEQLYISSPSVSLKNEIRSVQKDINDTNAYLISNSILPLIYSDAIFDENNKVKTQWGNEKDISNTQGYELKQSPVIPVDQQKQEVSISLQDVNNLILSAQQNIKSNTEKLKILMDQGISTDLAPLIAETRTLLNQFHKDLKGLLNSKETLENVQKELNELNQNTESIDRFSSNIRNQLRQKLMQKPGYTESVNDVNAAVEMRRKALDEFYTAKTDTEINTAQKRIEKVVESLDPSVPITRKIWSDDELLLTSTLDEIATLNTQIKPLLDAQDAALQNFINANTDNNTILAEQYDNEYKNLDEQKQVIIDEINKKYETILGFRSSKGLSSMFPGSNTVAEAKPNPNEKTIIYDTEEKRFVTEAEKTGSPGRYITKEYADRPVSQAKTEEEKIQSILSEKYYEQNKARADYELKRNTEDAKAQNEIRIDMLAKDTKKLEDTKKEYEEKKKDLSNDEILQYQAKINNIENDIKDSRTVIDSNNSVILQANLKYDKDVIPFRSFDEKGAEVSTAASAKTVEAITIPPEQKNISENISDFYDSRSQRIIAGRQEEAAKKAVEIAQKRLNADPTNVAAQKELESAQNKLKDATSNYKTKVDNEFKIAEVTRAQAEKIKDPKELSRLGYNEEDVNRILANNQNIGEKLSDTIVAQRIENYRQDYQQRFVKKEEQIKNQEGTVADLEKELAAETDPQRREQLQLELGAAREKLDKLNSEYSELEAEGDRYEEIYKNIEDAVLEELQIVNAEFLDSKRSNTGFEQINSGAPFYMQFPTLNAITAFRLRNGHDPYGTKSTESIARDAVNFKIFETIPGVDRAEQSADKNFIINIPQKNNILTVGSFTIYPSDSNWLKQTHTHQYSQGTNGAIAKMAQLGLDFLNNAEGIAKMVNLGIDAAQRGSLKGGMSAGDVYNRSIDVLDIYNDTDKQEIEVEFNLFTKDDFLNDVFRPLMFLTGLSYPKRALRGDLGDITSNTISKLIKGLEANKDNSYAKYVLEIIQKISGASSTSDAANKVDQAGKDLGKFINEIETALGEYGGLGPYRYYISKRPEFMSVRHVSGLFYFPLAYITKVSYEFKGPWYNINGQQIKETKDLENLLSTAVDKAPILPPKTFREQLDQNVRGVARGIRETFRPPPPTVPRPADPPTPRPSMDEKGLLGMSEMTYASIYQQGMPYAYPSHATARVSVKNATKFFRDDFLALFYSSQVGGQELVSVTQKLTNQETFAYGGAKAFDNLAENKRK